MTRLEDLTCGATLQGLLPATLVTIVEIRWAGSDAVDLAYKGADGRPDDRLPSREDETSIWLAQGGMLLTD